jgi:hypothetical protein
VAPGRATPRCFHTTRCPASAREHSPYSEMTTWRTSLHRRALSPTGTWSRCVPACGAGWTGLGLADTGVRGLDLPHVNGRSETTRRRGHPPAPVVHQRFGRPEPATLGPLVCAPGMAVLNSCPRRRKFQYAAPKPTDKRHRIVKQVGNDPTEASFRAIGAFPSHQPPSGSRHSPSVGTAPRAGPTVPNPLEPPGAPDRAAPSVGTAPRAGPTVPARVPARRRRGLGDLRRRCSGEQDRGPLLTDASLALGEAERVEGRGDAVGLVAEQPAQDEFVRELTLGRGPSKQWRR